MTRMPQTNVELAAKLGISERQFYRRLQAKEPTALALQREDLLKAHGDTLREVLVDLNHFGDKLRYSDPKLAAALLNAATALAGALYPPEEDEPDLSTLAR
jgi:hypothetical protein